MWQPYPGKPTFWQRLTKYLRDVRVEMRKVSWPNRPGADHLYYCGIGDDGYRSGVHRHR